MKAHTVKVRPYSHWATSKWVVSITVDVKRQRKFFADEKLADTYADQQATKLINEGIAGLGLSDENLSEAETCLKKPKPYRVTLEKLVSDWIKLEDHEQ